jgi:hypothetical protein
VRSSGETLQRKRKTLESFSSVCDSFIESANAKHGIATLTSENVQDLKSRFRRDAWKRYLSLYKGRIAASCVLAALIIFIAVISYGVSEQKLHVDTVLGITWMDNSEYLPKYHKEYAAQFLSNMRFQRIKFFAAGKDVPADNNRKYQSQFDNRTTRFVYAQADFSHPRPKERIDFPLEFKLLGPSGSQVKQVVFNSHVETTWDNSYTYVGFGEDRVRNWEKGRYTVEVLMNGKSVGSQSFVIN